VGVVSSEARDVHLDSHHHYHNNDIHNSNDVKLLLDDNHDTSQRLLRNVL